jgi:hypothetical protein
MWNRVMFIKGAKDETATEMDEEKWKKERSFWKIRADNFNCIMRQIQGKHEDVDCSMQKLWT